MRLFLLIISTFLIPFPLQVRASIENNNAVSFYRDKSSLFPSGQASRRKLEENLLHSETEIIFRTTWDKKDFTLEEDQILRDIQVARYVESIGDTDLHSLNRSDSPKIKKIPAKTQLEILETTGLWARVQIKENNMQGWLPLPHIKVRHDDVGYFVNIMDTYIRLKNNPTAKVLTTLPRLSRVIPLEITKNYLKIQFQNQVGYADITDFASHSDFANLAYHPKKNWRTVFYRNNDNVITKSGESIPLKELLGFVPNTHRGIVVRADSNFGPPLRSRVEIIKPEAYAWALSRVDGHGDVWWKIKNLLLEDKEKNLTNTLTTDELLKREIYSISFENKNSLRGIASSEGVYATEDGVTWTLIPHFGKKNYPVNIHPNGTWLVGSYKSTNQGKHFEPFIRWDQITKAIEDSYHRNPKLLRLTKIDSLPNSQIEIQVETGHNKVKLKSFLDLNYWQVIKN